MGFESTQYNTMVFTTTEEAAEQFPTTEMFIPNNQQQQALTGTIDDDDDDVEELRKLRSASESIFFKSEGARGMRDRLDELVDDWYTACSIKF